MALKITITGLEEATAGLFDSMEKQFRAIAGAMYAECLDIMADSKDNYCPVDTGTLKSTGTVQPPEIIGRNVKIRMGYGGSAAPYALAVHENPRSGKTGGLSPDGKRKYKTWARVGQWKYLETPVLQRVKNFSENVKNRLKG